MIFFLFYSLNEQTPDYSVTFRKLLCGCIRCFRKTKSGWSHGRPSFHI